MAKMINVDELIEFCNTERAMLHAHNNSVACAALRRVVEFAKEYAAEAEPVKQGRWIENSDPGQNINEHYMCSECGCTFHNWANDNYCPNCGSKNRLDGDSDDEP